MALTKKTNETTILLFGGAGSVLYKINLLLRDLGDFSFYLSFTSNPKKNRKKACNSVDKNKVDFIGDFIGAY